MTDQELAISRSTPRARFDAPPPAAASAPKAAPKTSEPPPRVTPAAAAFVAEVTADAKQPVVMFALEWCEFCWSVRRMFASYKIPYRSIDLDSVAYQKDDWGGQIRGALAARTTWKTIPQIFIGNEFVGGATDTFDAWKSGKLPELLAKHGVAHRGELAGNPYGFLPNWLQPR
jgi:cysteine synthase A